jgi:PBP1b-binding outer membrane lipoprotein LpoB
VFRKQLLGSAWPTSWRELLPQREALPDEPGPAADALPDSAEGRLLLGRVYAEQGKIPKAIEEARGVLGIPEIASAKVAPRIVLDPVVNETRFPINKDIFLTRIRSQLNEKSMGKVRFLDREMMKTLERERDLKRSGQVTASSDPNVVEFRGADYFLTGKLQGLTTKSSQGTSDYILYSFRLTDARTSEIVWESSSEIKKQGLEDAAYR